MKVLCEKCGALAEGRLEARPGGGAALVCGACGAEISLTEAVPGGPAPPTPSSPSSPTPTSAPIATAPPTPTSTETSPASPSQTATPSPPGPPAATPSADLASATHEAWAQVLTRWDDEEAHRTFLARFGDLEGLAEAGRRYREVLSEKPGDATALRWRDEILKRATAQGLSQLPRLSPPRASPKVYRWAVVGGMVGAMALAAGWLAWRLLSMARG